MTTRPTTKLLDLNEVRDRLLQDQRDNQTVPVDPTKKVRVDRAGDIVYVKDAGGADARKLSQARTDSPPDCFHSGLKIGPTSGIEPAGS